MTSTIKVNKIEKVDGSTIELGGPGTAVTLACGATQTGFGRAGAVNWCSTIYTNSPGTVTATSGKGFFLNTTSGAITINLPSSPTVGDIVAIKDYANTFDSNAVTVGRGGSKIAGLCLDGTLSTDGQSITLIYADSTRGWLNVNTDSTVQGTSYVTATGGTITTSGDFKIHTFTSSGCFQVTDAGTPSGSTTIDYAVIAGGGGGGSDAGGGGGGGGFRVSNGYSLPAPTMSPLINPTGITASVATFPITVGGGGTGSTGSPGYPASTSGANSIFSTITSTGGGGGGATASNPALNGGSGGGGGGGVPGGQAAGSGNTPPVSPPQGQNGGLGVPNPSGLASGGGGGAGAAGTAGQASPQVSGAGGVGSFLSPSLAVSCAGTTGPTPSVRYFSGGGGGGNYSPYGPKGVGGSGGGGAGSDSGAATAGTTNTGGGAGGGAGGGGAGANGGSGIVLIRYKFQN